MGFNVTHTMNSSQFENRENLRNAVKNILNRQGASAEATQKIIEQTIFTTRTYSPQLDIINASVQITLNNSIKETLNNLKSKNDKKKAKKPVFGEIWAELESIEENYQGELVFFEIDGSAKNIFAAA